MTETNESTRNDALRFEVELAMQVGGAFGDGMTPAQAIDVVKNGEPLVISRRLSIRAGAPSLLKAA